MKKQKKAPKYEEIYDYTPLNTLSRSFYNEYFKTFLLIIIITSITVTSFLWIAIFNSIKPEFTIYKEECRNETDRFSKLSWSGCNIGCLYYGDIINGDPNDSDKCKSFCYDYILYTETCENIEVNEINLIISKQDLTIDWLDENCKCRSGCLLIDKGRNLVECPDPCDEFTCFDTYIVEVEE